MFSKTAILLLIGISLFFTVQLFAQQRGDDSTKVLQSKPDTLKNPSNLAWKPCTAVFVELLGKGFLSLNIDFRRKESYAITIGFQPMEVLMPEIIYYHFGGERHRFELGGGFSAGLNNKLEMSGVLIHGVIGYRSQKKNGLFFRAGLTPLYVIFFDKDNENSNKLYPFVGLSWGYSF